MENILQSRKGQKNGFFTVFKVCDFIKLKVLLSLFFIYTGGASSLMAHDASNSDIFTNTSDGWVDRISAIYKYIDLEQQSLQSYALPITNGKYQITFVFKNNLDAAQKSAKIFVEGQEIVSSLNTYQTDVSNPSFSVIKSATVQDGTLNIGYSTSLESVKLAMFIKLLDTSIDTDQNQVPLISVAASATTYQFGDTIVLTANASDPDGAVANVTFYANGMELGQVNPSIGTNQIDFSWENAAEGDYTIYAKAVDNEGANAFSSHVSLSVQSDETVDTPGSSPSPSGSQIEVIAAGAVGDEGMSLRIGDVEVRRWENIGGDAKGTVYETYSYTHDTEITDISSIQVAYTGGGSNSSDLRVDKIIVDGAVYETEASDTYSTGTWQKGGLVADYHQSEWLHAEGYFHYKHQSASTPSPNQLPEVTMDMANLDYTEGEAIELRATASDPDGIVSGVDFYVNGSQVGSVVPTSGQASYVWQSATAGIYTVSAAATDDTGATAISAEETLRVEAAGSGSQIEVIAAGAVGDEGMSLRIGDVEVRRWENIGGDAKGTVYETYSYTHDTEITDISSIQVAYTGGGSNSSDLRVDKIIVDGAVYETEASDTYSTGTWQKGGLVADYHQSEWLHAEGYFHYKHQSASTPSPNQLPEVTMDMANLDYTEGEAIELRATASDPDGIVSGVDFYVNGSQVGSVVPTSGQASYVWQSATAGIYTVSAAATDDTGATAISAEETLRVEAAGSGSQIKVIAAGAVGDEGMSLRIGDVEVRRWENIGGDAKGTVYETYSYTHDTEITDISSIQVAYTGGGSNSSDLRVDKIIVDGAVYETEASDTYSTGTWQKGGVVADYHQSEWLHAEGYFHYKHQSASTPSPNQLPEVTMDMANLDYTEGEAIELRATASDPDGIVSGVDFYVNGSQVGSVVPTSGQASYVWQSATAGIYTVSAAATDDTGATAISAEETLRVEAAGGGSQIKVIAAGAVGDEGMSLRIGDVEVRRWENIGGDAKGTVYETYSYTHDTEITDISSIQVAYTGGGSNSSDLRVDKIIVDGAVYETEASDTYSTGTWQKGGVVADYHQSEWLHAEGYFHYKHTEFSSSSASNLRTSDEKDHTEVVYSEFSVFPNPVIDKFTIQMPEYLEINHVKIVDLNGTIVYAEDQTSYNGKVEVNISDYNLAEGRYGLLVYLKDGSVMKEDFLKQEPF